MLDIASEISRKIRQATQESGERSATNIAEDARRHSENLARDFERLFLIVEALWEIVKEQNNLNDDHLVNLIDEIDGRDGKVDGKKAKSVRPDCPNCGRKIIGHNKSCLWCGAAIKPELFSRS